MSADIDSDTNQGGTNAAVRTQRGAAGVAAADSEPPGLFERVLVVADGDTTGDAAVVAGIDLAATHGASVDALYVVDTTEAWDMVVERNEREGERAVEAAAARGTACSVDVEKWFRYGTAHEEVLGFAEAHDVDCIVVGSARRTGLDRLIHPNPLPARLQRDGSVPVLVVGADD
jgi:nucleotide-binding universal stress UspA family protein